MVRKVTSLDMVRGTGPLTSPLTESQHVKEDVEQSQYDERERFPSTEEIAEGVLMRLFGDKPLAMIHSSPLFPPHIAN